MISSHNCFRFQSSSDVPILAFLLSTCIFLYIHFYFCFQIKITIISVKEFKDVEA